MWTPDRLEDYLIGVQVVRSEAKSEITDRLDQISEWFKSGGILLMSYEYFRMFVLNEPTKKRGAPLDSVQHKTIERELLKGPDIIIADEAHKLKNDASKISKAVSMLRSRSRIALTGSPLSNNLEEYYAMINWIAPGYLGNAVEFRSKYVEPIREGLYSDSSSYEKRRALTRLSLLNQNIDPKINRADITCMKDSLPPKTEFVITVSLTEIQDHAYKVFVDAQRHGSGDVSQARLFDWLRLLSLICNHPQCFKTRITHREEEKAEKAVKLAKLIAESRRNSTDDTSMASDNDMTPTTTALPPLPPTSGMSKESIDQILSCLPPEDDLSAPSLSNKTLVLKHIIDESINAGDKLLIFSQSIPTLNYLQWLCENMEAPWERLDGSTQMKSRQKTAKNFNSGSSEKSVFLISTRAGGLGLNLFGANRVVIFDFDFNPTWEEQAVGRAYRFGQLKPVFVYRFKAGGTFEDVIEMKTVFKTQLASRVVDKKNPIRFASKSAKDYLFEPKPVTQKNLDEFRGKDPKVLDKILNMNLGCIKALDLTETFHTESDEALTAEEMKEVKEQLEGEILKRVNPDEYEKWQLRQQAKEMAKRQSDMQSNIPSDWAGSVVARLGGLRQSIPSMPAPFSQQPRQGSVYPTDARYGPSQGALPTSQPTAPNPSPTGIFGTFTTRGPPPPVGAKPGLSSRPPPSNAPSATSTAPTIPSNAQTILSNAVSVARYTSPTIRAPPTTSMDVQAPPALATPIATPTDSEIEGVEKNVDKVLTINSEPEDQMEGIEIISSSPITTGASDLSTADKDKNKDKNKVKWQQQLTKLANCDISFHALTSPQMSRSSEWALEAAFEADDHVKHPKQGSTEWERMKREDWSVWRGSFKKMREMYEKDRWGKTKEHTERQRVLGNPLEFRWCAEKGYEEEEEVRKEIVEDEVGISGKEAIVGLDEQARSGALKQPLPEPGLEGDVVADIEMKGDVDLGVGRLA
jgi:superfamily II DNA or RNA helicase